MLVLFGVMDVLNFWNRFGQRTGKELESRRRAHFECSRDFPDVVLKVL